MLTKGKVLQLLFMLVILLALFFWRTFDNGADKAVTEALTKPNTMQSVVRCDYQDGCEFISDWGTFLLNVKDLPIKAEEWINFELTVPNEGVQISNAQIVGKSMFMGKVPVNFSQSDTYQFNAKAIVAACVHDEMVWILQISVDNGVEQQQLEFDFLIKK